MTGDEATGAGARNLVAHCAELQPGERVLIVHEDPALGWYDAALPAAVAAEVRKLGIEPRLLAVGAPSPEAAAMVLGQVGEHDCTLFFSRIGDQHRFEQLPPGVRAVMCYLRDVRMLASPYGRSDHRALRALKNAVDGILFGARHIEISCAHGTRIAGAPGADEAPGGGEVSTRRFPLGVPRPMKAAGFSGQVALRHYLTPTGSRLYEPSSLALDGPILGRLERGRIAGFDGETRLVEQVQAHYRHVAGRFDIDADAVDSWHAGIHPACAYFDDAAADPDRWSNSVFTNPRFLHFHTCGDYAPGEICWMVQDPGVSVDGVKLWEDGRLYPDRFAAGRQCLRDWPLLGELLARPSNAIGV